VCRAATGSIVLGAVAATSSIVIGAISFDCHYTRSRRNRKKQVSTNAVVCWVKSLGWDSINPHRDFDARLRTVAMVLTLIACRLHHGADANAGKNDRVLSISRNKYVILFLIIGKSTHWRQSRLSQAVRAGVLMNSRNGHRPCRRRIFVAQNSKVWRC